MDLFAAIVNAEPLKNPLAGGPTDIASFVQMLGKILFNFAIPISVIVIIYGGIRMLFSGGKPENYKKGLDALKYASLGLAVMLIGYGFVSLIKSALSVKP